MKYAIYSGGMTKAVDFIEKNIRNDITYREAASAAGMSKDNFWRVFKKLFNETITNYIKGRRLTLIAKKLIRTKRTFASICMEFGCDSPEIITRAFKRKFNITPAEYRKKRQYYEYLETPKLTEKAIRHILKNGVTLKNRNFREKGYYIYGISGKVRMKNVVIDALKIFSSFLLCRQRPYFFNEPKVVAFAGPVDGCELRKLHTDSVMEVMFGVKNRKIPGFSRKKVPGGRYAVFIHKGNADLLPITYKYMLNTVSKIYKKKQNPKYLYKITGNELNMGDSMCLEIYLPLSGIK